MIAIVVSRELAEEQPAFVAECGQRGHRVTVFEPCAEESGDTTGGMATDAAAQTSGREGGVR